MEDKDYKKEYPKKWWNPKVSEFLELHDDKTLIGFAWSLQWRLSLVISVIYACILVLLLILFPA